MDHELQNEMNRTRHLLKMKRLLRVIKSKNAFDAEINKLAKIQRFKMRVK